MAFATKIRKVRFQTVGYTGEQMAAAGREMIDESLIPRLRAGNTVYDVPASPLQENYKRAKVRRGLQPKRDWTLTGRTVRCMKVITAQPNKGRIGFTDSISNMRAAINNARVRQFGFGRGDYPKLGAALAKQGGFVRAVVTS